MVVKSEVSYLHSDDHHHGDPVDVFALRDKADGKIHDRLTTGKSYKIIYSISLDCDGGFIVSALGKFGSVNGKMGLTDAILTYSDGNQIVKDFIIGFVDGMQIEEV